MKLFGKILGIGIIGIGFALVIAVIGLYSGNKIQYYQAEEAKFRSFRSELADAKNAHLQWLHSIDSTILSLNPKLTIGTDGKKCDFGKWYYSEEGNALVRSLPKTLQDGHHAIEKKHLAVHKMGHQLLEIWDPANPEPGKTFYLNEVLPVAKQLVGELAALEKETIRMQSDIRSQGRWWIENQSLPIKVTAIVSVIALIFISIYLARSIVKPLEQSRYVLMEIAQRGNTNLKISPEILRRKDEIGDLGRGVMAIIEDYRNISKMSQYWATGNWSVPISVKGETDVMNFNLLQMVQQVDKALQEIGVSVHKVNGGAREISLAANTLSAGAQTSASSLEEVAASMNEISSQTKANADSTAEVRDLANRTMGAVSEGQEAMKRMNEAMVRIRDNSNEIQRVVKVIDDIAFQTNLLALNAAVEAARAGVHGKGFAVVAEEVRNLASRSAKAAHETTELISRSGREIIQGDEVATQTASILDSIVEQIKETTRLVSEIALATHEQSQGVEQITIGLQQIDSVTQQNMATAEQTASASCEMSKMANDLENLLGKFVLSETKQKTNADIPLETEEERMEEDDFEMLSKHSYEVVQV